MLKKLTTSILNESVLVMRSVFLYGLDTASPSDNVSIQIPLSVSVLVTLKRGAQISVHVLVSI